MRWFRRGQAAAVEQDPARQQELLAGLRQRFGGHVPGRFADQALAITAELTGGLPGDEGVAVAAAILREFADAAYADLYAQAEQLHRRTGRGFAPNRADYRPLWQAVGPELRWNLFTLPVGLQPYVHVSAATMVISAQAKRAPASVVPHLFEVLDLTLDGWEFARVRVDTDAASLAEGLIAAARDVLAAMSDPPSLPDPVRQWMRRRVVIKVADPETGRSVGTFDPGRTMREFLLA